MAKKITIDFETRSACDIGRGAWLYSLHPTTQILCLSYKIGNGPTKSWHVAHPNAYDDEGNICPIFESDVPQDLFDAIASGMLVEAHNRFFEYCIWTNIMMRVYGWPPIKREQWRCSAAKAAYYGLPRKLEMAALVLGLKEQKDMAGSKIMMKLTKPRKLKKAEREQYRQKGIDPDTVIVWHENVNDLKRNWVYCDQDVNTEHEFSEALPDLPEMELRIWQMDQDMNLRGIKCDRELVKKALKLREYEVTSMNAELSDMTGGEIVSATSRKAFKDWLASEFNLILPDTTAKTLDHYLPNLYGPDLRDHMVKTGLTPVTHRALTILREVNRSSTAKFEAMLDRMDDHDDRLRDLMMYHGAGTGRWSGKGVQPHNFPRGNIKDMTLACWAIMTGERSIVKALYGDIMQHLSGALRGALIPSEGMDLIVADYAAIEARVVFWLAGDKNALSVFQRKDGDIYCDMATGVYGYPVHKKTHPNERQFGKQGILGLGFEMGFLKFLITCRKYDIYFTEAQARKIVGSDFLWEKHKTAVLKYFASDKRRRNTLEENDLTIKDNLHEMILMKHVVDTYRARYPEVTAMWRDQEAAALDAMRHPGKRVYSERGRCTWVLEEVGTAGEFLRCFLPSGRPLHYFQPKIMRKKTPWKNPDGSPVYKPCVTYMGVDSKTKKWVRQDAYGGKLVENITQATARDLMAYALVLVDDGDEYVVLLSVHDELICEVNENRGNVKAFEKLMSTIPGWAHGCPVEAEGWRGKRYRK